MGKTAHFVRAFWGNGSKNTKNGNERWMGGFFEVTYNLGELLVIEENKQIRLCSGEMTIPSTQTR